MTINELIYFSGGICLGMFVVMFCVKLGLFDDIV